MKIEELFDRHVKVTLFYSGGKDSLACLLLMEPFWHRTDVVFLNTGNQFPEVIEHMTKIAKLVPSFHVIHSNAAKYVREHGQPVDLVPTTYTDVGQYIYGKRELKVCSRFDCCNANLWEPMTQWFKLTRPTCVVRGDRGSEREMGKTEFEGIEFAFPIFDWTRDQVMELVRGRGKKLGLYQERHELSEGSSLDCMTCTAYNVEHRERMKYLRDKHPDLYKANEEFFKAYKLAVFEELREVL